MLQRSLQAVIEGRFSNPVASFIGKGWKISEDRESLPENRDPSKVSLESALRSGEKYVTGEETLGRFAEKPLLGVLAYQFYCNNRHLIPNEWMGKYVFFDATVLLNPLGSRCSLYLCWSGGAWVWDCYGLGYGRRAHYVSAVLAS